jgi:hypothetical protein
MLDERRKWQIGCRLNAMNRIIPKKESELEMISSHLPEIADEFPNSPRVLQLMYEGYKLKNDLKNLYIEFENLNSELNEN